MAGDWLKMEHATPDKPETFAIAGILGIDDPDLVVGKLFRVWRWFDQHTVDGNAHGVTSALLDRIACCNGFATAMEQVGWLVVTGSGLSLPKFDRHNGKTAKNRAETARRVAKHRSGNGACNGVGVTEPVQNALAREEKSREEEESKSLVPADAATPPKVDKSERLAAVTRDAVAAYNDALAKPRGLLAAVTLPDSDTRRANVKRCLRVAALICQDQFADSKVTPEFWRAYFASVKCDPFLSGAGPYSGSHANWRPDFEFLTRPETVEKVFDKAVSA